MDQLLEGLPVLWIAEGSVAMRAGVQRGDRLLIANGVAMTGFDSYVEARDKDADKLEMTVQRGNQILDFTLVFDHAKGSQQGDGDGSQPSSGRRAT